MTNMTVLSDWQFYFKKSDGMDNMHNAISSFAPFWNEFNLPLFITNDKFIIGGKIPGKDNIFYTQTIVCVERVNHEFRGDVAHDLMRAVTASGEQFFFYSDEHTPEMRAAMGDMLQFHRFVRPISPKMLIPTA